MTAETADFTAGKRFGLASALVSIPSFIGVFGVIAFAIGVALHGF
jgi:hypothetical protein